MKREFENVWHMEHSTVKPLVAQLLNEFPVVYGIMTFIMDSKETPTGTVLNQMNPARNSHPI
jgi:hypothetical protein